MAGCSWGFSMVIWAPLSVGVIVSTYPQPGLSGLWRIPTGSIHHVETLDLESLMTHARVRAHARMNRGHLRVSALNYAGFTHPYARDRA
jgi:hypothetical protein